MSDFDLKWEEFSNIPIDENERTEEVFLHFPIGTDKNDIWHWFEDKYKIIL